MDGEEARRRYEAAITKLTTAQAKLASAQAQVRRGNARSAAIAESIIPTMQRRIAEANQEIELVRPHVPERKFGWTLKIHSTPRTTPLSEEELASLEIPEFLRRPLDKSQIPTKSGANGTSS